MGEENLEAEGTGREGPGSGGYGLMISSWQTYTPKVDMTYPQRPHETHAGIPCGTPDGGFPEGLIDGPLDYGP